MADRIGDWAALLEHLSKLYSDWSHVTSQIGMFAYTGLTADECTQMIEKHHVYLTKMGGLAWLVSRRIMRNTSLKQWRCCKRYNVNH